MWLPKELFFVVVTIRLARANSEMDKMMSATRISIKLKPFDCLKEFNTHLPMEIVLQSNLAKPIPTGFLSQEDRLGKQNVNDFDWFEVKTEGS
jgi:hypothetical protein